MDPTQDELNAEARAFVAANPGYRLEMVDGVAVTATGVGMERSQLERHVASMRKAVEEGGSFNLSE